MSGLPPPSSSLPPPPRFDYGREDGYQGRPYDGPKDRAYDRDRDNWERDSRRDHQHRGPGGPRSRTPEGEHRFLRFHQGAIEAVWFVLNFPFSSFLFLRFEWRS